MVLLILKHTSYLMIRESTGQQTIIYQGTSNEAINPNNPLKSSGFGDDWLQNAKLMNNDNESTDYLKQVEEFANSYRQKLKMLLFLMKMNLEENTKLNLIITKQNNCGGWW